MVPKVQQIVRHFTDTERTVLYPIENNVVGRHNLEQDNTYHLVEHTMRSIVEDYLRSIFVFLSAGHISVENVHPTSASLRSSFYRASTYVCLRIFGTDHLPGFI